MGRRRAKNGGVGFGGRVIVRWNRKEDEEKNSKKERWKVWGNETIMCRMWGVEWQKGREMVGRRVMVWWDGEEGEEEPKNKLRDWINMDDMT